MDRRGRRRDGGGGGGEIGDPGQPRAGGTAIQMGLLQWCSEPQV